MADRPSEIVYHLPRSTIVASGIATSRRRLDNGERETSATVDIAHVVEADDDDFYILDLDSDMLEDREFSLKLTPDGRLTNASNKSTGVGARIVSGLVTLASTAIGAKRLFMALSDDTVVALSKAQQPRDGEFPKTYNQAHPELHARRQKANETLGKLADKQLDIATTAADSTGQDPDDERQTYRTAAGAVKALRSLEAELRDEVDAIDRHESAWTSAIQDRIVEPYELSLQIGELLDRATVDAWLKEVPTDEEIKRALSPSAQELFDKTGLVLSATVPTIPAKGAKDRSELKKWKFGAIYGVVFRHPYSAWIHVWDVTGEGSERRLEEAQRQKLMLVSNDSPLGIVPFNSAVFSKRSVGVAFHDNGSLSEVTNESTSGLAAAFDSLSGAPGSVASALEGVEKVRSAASTLDNAGVNSAIAKLENEKKRLDAEIGLKNTTATASVEMQRAKLQAAIDFLKTRSALGDELAKLVEKS